MSNAIPDDEENDRLVAMYSRGESPLMEGKRVKRVRTKVIDIPILNEELLGPEWICVRGVYCITHTTSRKRYIGMSNDVWRRYTEHCAHRGMSSKCLLYNDLRLYGNDKFTFQLLENCGITGRTLIEVERGYIELFKTYILQFGYNLRGCPLEV